MARRLSNALEAGFCAEALTEALGLGRPEVFNTDQSLPLRRRGQPVHQPRVHPGATGDRGVNISMDGMGRYSEDIFVQRLWRTVK